MYPFLFGFVIKGGNATIGIQEVGGRGERQRRSDICRYDIEIHFECSIFEKRNPY